MVTLSTLGTCKYIIVSHQISTGGNCSSLCLVIHFVIISVKGGTKPLPWASVHWLVQCTLECHCNATGWSIVHWNTTGRPSEYLQGTLDHHWKNLVETAHTGMSLGNLSLIRPTLGCQWRNSNFCSLQWNTTGGTVTAHTCPDTYS